MVIKERKIIFSILLFAFFAMSCSQDKRLDILLIYVDDMADWVGCMGGYQGTVYTPNIDRLAQQGVLFTNAHCTSPICGPSRAAIMTGLRPEVSGVYHNIGRSMMRLKISTYILFLIRQPQAGQMLEG